MRLAAQIPLRRTWSHSSLNSVQHNRPSVRFPNRVCLFVHFNDAGFVGPVFFDVSDGTSELLTYGPRGKSVASSAAGSEASSEQGRQQCSKKAGDSAGEREGNRAGSTGGSIAVSSAASRARARRSRLQIPLAPRPPNVMASLVARASRQLRGNEVCCRATLNCGHRFLGLILFIRP